MLLGAVGNVYVYHSFDTKQSKNAISRMISLWPIVAGRLRLIDNEHYSIKLTDNPIPFAYIASEKIER